MIKLLGLSFLIGSFLCLEAKDRWVKVSAPRALPEDAKTYDWSRFNGHGDDAKPSETNLLADWSEKGPSLIWSLEKGYGYASPSIVDGVLVIFHRIDGNEVAEGRNPETGAPIWEYSYPVDYRDRYGYSAGPRASPVVSQGRV